MIPLTDLSWQGQPWQWQLSHAVRDANELAGLLGLSPETVSAAAASDFRLLVPRPYLARIEPQNPTDPLLLQVLPAADEVLQADGFTGDPVGDSQAAVMPGLLHKYAGRVLVIVSGACAINCRYCFRRHFPYDDFKPDTTDWDAILDYVAGDPSIREVILSGGDPLVLSDRRLAAIVKAIDRIAHVDTVRVHTRLPIVIPGRVCAELLDWVAGCRVNVVFVMHANHPREIDGAVRQAMSQLKRAGATLLNQSVLLKAVNDDPETLGLLSRQLFGAGVLPYYLHLLDPVAGAAHFNVDDTKASLIMTQLRDSLPGYLVPRLVREFSGEPAKVPFG